MMLQVCMDGGEGLREEVGYEDTSLSKKNIDPP